MSAGREFEIVGAATQFVCIRISATVTAAASDDDAKKTKAKVLPEPQGPTGRR